MGKGGGSTRGGPLGVQLLAEWETAHSSGFLPTFFISLSLSSAIRCPYRGGASPNQQKTHIQPERVSPVPHSSWRCPSGGSGTPTGPSRVAFQEFLGIINSDCSRCTKSLVVTTNVGNAGAASLAPSFLTKAKHKKAAALLRDGSNYTTTGAFSLHRSGKNETSTHKVG